MATEDESTLISTFLLEEYKDLYQNVIHIEKKLFNHLSFFTTLFLGTMTASIAIFRLPESNAISLLDAIGLISIPYLFLFIFGRLEIRMITELRVRKIKFIEGIVKIREFFISTEPKIADYVVLPTSLIKAPPYLRIGSQDWYILLFVSLLNSVSFIIFLTGLPLFLCFMFKLFFSPNLKLCITDILAYIIWEFASIMFTIFIFWNLSYKPVMNFCGRYDKLREEKVGGPSQYDLLYNALPESRLMWSISDWFRYFYEKRKENDE